MYWNLYGMVKICICCYAFLYASAVYCQSDAEAPESLYQLESALDNLELDPTRVAAVDNVYLQKDVTLFTLESGYVYLCKPVFGRTVAGLFVGKGQAEFVPPTKVEKEQYARFFQTDMLQKPITYLYILFADGTDKELAQELTFADGALPEKALEIMKYTAEEAILPSGGYKTFLENESNELFSAMFGQELKDSDYFFIDPYETEEIRYGRMAANGRDYFEIINQFHKEADYYSGISLKDETKETLKISHYTIECRIADNLDFSAQAQMDITGVKEQQRWLNLHLYHGLEIDSALWGDGSRAPVYAFKEGDERSSSRFWVQCDSALKAGDRRKLTIYYHGEILKREADYVFLYSSIGWYPLEDGLNHATFDLTFYTPERYNFVSIGKKTEEEENDDVVKTRWLMESPVRNASFNIGIFDEYVFEDERIPPVVLWMNRHGVSATITNAEELVGEDIVNSLIFYQHVYGAPSREKYTVTEIPYAHGEAFPGLMHFSWYDLSGRLEEGESETFRAHEVAHQWWGIDVDFKTYQDRWISEAFAEYSGMWYTQLILKDNDGFFSKLEKYKDRILDDRSSLLGSAMKAGPICLGHRNQTSLSPQNDYHMIVYEKGAWVLHMLRNMLIDLSTFSEDTFIAIMKEFYTTYKGSRASTEDFQKVVEKYVNADMSWFFEQWINGTAAPTYTYAYQTKKNADGTYTLSFRVKQTGVPENFLAYMPVRIMFDDDRSILQKISLVGKTAEFDFPPLAEEPTDFVFNEFQSVLCNWNEVDWDDWTKE